MRGLSEMVANPTLADVGTLAAVVVDLATAIDAALLSLRFHDTASAREHLERALGKAVTVYPPEAPHA